jgi:eukaryotic-like serine/threonine-protein kinase
VALRTLPSQRVFRFDAFEVDLRTGELRKGGTKLKIQEQPLKVLAMLLAQPGELVTREQLCKGLWSDDTFVDFERGLNTAVNRLRATLNDSAETPRFIETVGKRGYRLIAPVTNGGSGAAEAATERAAPSSRVNDWPLNGDEAAANVIPSDAAVAPRKHVTRRWGRATVVLTAVAIAIAAIGYERSRGMSRGARPNLENIQITKLTNHGKAEDVAISADGRYIAYLFRNGDDTSVRLRQVGEQGETQVLVHEPLLFPGIAFSPDGNHLYFLRATPKDTLYRELYEIPSLGGPDRKVVSNVDTAVSFSPDGRQFVYESGMPRKDSVEVRIANADGSGDRLLVSIQGAFAGYTTGAAWSPDGKSIAVPMWMHHRESGYLLDIVSTANGSVGELYSGNQELGRPRWLEGGNMLVVSVHDQSGRAQLWTISYPTGQMRRLTNDLADYDADIDITRDGRMLATVQHTIISNLSVSSSPDGSNAKQLTSGEQIVTQVFPVDGKIAMVNRADNHVWVMEANGGHPKIAADAARGFWFTACGRFILFAAQRGGAFELMRMDEDGANPKVLAMGFLWGESCSPDAKFVYYPEMLKPRWKIRRVPIDGGAPVDIVENPGEAIPGRVAVSPDGNLLAFPFDVASPEPTLKIGVVSIAGGPLAKIIDVPNDIEGLCWSPDGGSLQFLWDKNGAINLWEQPLVGGPPHQLTNFTPGRIFDFNWTADGKQLLLARGEVTSDVVLLSNLR